MRNTVLVLPLVLSGCLMPAEVDQLNAAVDRMETVLTDTASTPEEMGQAIEEFKATTAEMSARTEERKEAGQDLVEQLVPGGSEVITMLAGILGLNLWRNRTRKAGHLLPDTT